MKGHADLSGVGFVDDTSLWAGTACENIVSLITVCVVTVQDNKTIGIRFGAFSSDD